HHLVPHVLLQLVHVLAAESAVTLKAPPPRSYGFLQIKHDVPPGRLLLVRITQGKGQEMAPRASQGPRGCAATAAFPLPSPGIPSASAANTPAGVRLPPPARQTPAGHRSPGCAVPDTGCRSSTAPPRPSARAHAG